ncbi:MAG: sialidase family protein [Candidatus Nitrosocaldus sp.]
MIRDKGLIVLLISSLLVYAVMQYMGIGVIPLRYIIGGGSVITNHGLDADVVMDVEGSDVYIAWYDHIKSAIMLKASSDGGSSFRDVLVSSVEGVESARVRGIVAKGSYVNVVWSAEVDGQYDIFLSNSRDGALTFSTINISNNDGDSEYPVIDASGPTVYIAWVDLTYGNSEILLRVSRDGGSTFSNVINVSNSNGESEAPVLVAEGSSVYIAWHDNTQGVFAVMFRASHDNGNTFSDPVILSSIDYDSGFATMDVDGSNVYTVWMSKDNANNGGNDKDGYGFSIKMRYSSDGGRSFSEAVSIGKGRSPIVKVDGSLVCIVWIVEDGIQFASMYGKDIKDAISIDIDAQSIRNIILDVEGNTISILLLGEMDRASNSNSNDRNYSNSSSIIMYIGSRDAGLTFSSTKVVEGLMVDDVSMLSKGRGVYIAWSEKVCADPNCSHVRIGYHFGKSNDLSYQFTVRSIN